MDPGCLSRIRIFFPSRIQGQKDSRIRIKEFKYFNLKFFLSSRKYDPGCSSRTRTLNFYPSRIAGSKGNGSGSATLPVTSLFRRQQTKTLFITPFPGISNRLTGRAVPYLQKYLGILRIGDNIEEVLWEDVECVGVIQGEHEDGRLRELVVARGDARHSLHPFEKEGQAHEIIT